MKESVSETLRGVTFPGGTGRRAPGTRSGGLLADLKARLDPGKILEQLRGTGGRGEVDFAIPVVRYLDGHTAERGYFLGGRGSGSLAGVAVVLDDAPYGKESAGFGENQHRAVDGEHFLPNGAGISPEASAYRRGHTQEDVGGTEPCFLEMA